MPKQFIISILLIMQSLLGGSQYYTSGQINTINTNKTASEVGLYLDIISENYFIGLINGQLIQVNIDSTVVNGIINQNLDDSIKVTIFPIWAKESGYLDANAFEWPFGNGDDTVANFGIVVSTGCELFAVGLTLIDGTEELEVYKNEIFTGATGGAGRECVGATLNRIKTPIIFLAGDNLNFKTLKASGANNGGKVVAWLRIPSKTSTYDRLRGSGEPASELGNNDDDYLDITTGDKVGMKHLAITDFGNVISPLGSLVVIIEQL